MSNITVTTTKASSGLKFREYGAYKELFYNLTLRELRSKYKRSVIGWGWSMINPLANMLVYTIVFSELLKIAPLEGVPSGLHSYALMYLSGMLPWTMFQSSVMESMGSLLGNQNLIQKTYFPRELLPASTVASKLVSHVIEMSLLVAVVIGFGNWRAAIYIPGVIVMICLLTLFSLGFSLLFSIANVFYRDIQHFLNIFFFIWMFLTAVAYPFYIVGGGLSGPPSDGVTVLRPPRMEHLFGHAFSLGGLFKLNPMTDAILLFQSFIYNSSLPSATYVLKFPPLPGSRAPQLLPVHSNVSWFDLAYFVVWAVVAFVIGLWVFRKYESRLPEEL